MNHRQASKLIVEWVDGALEPTVAAGVEHHVARCGDCGELSRLYRMMRRVSVHGEGRDHARDDGRGDGRDDGQDGPGGGPGDGPDGPTRAADAQDGHPADSKLYVYALGMQSWDAAEVAAIEAHLDGCDRCRGEVEEIRGAKFSASTGESFWDRVAGFVRGSAAVPRPALALLAVGLLGAAALWWGTWRQAQPLRDLTAMQVRSITELRAESEALQARADAARERVQALERVRTGAARVLMLPRIVRSGTADRIPSVPAQGTQVIQVEIELGGDGSSADQQFYATVRDARADQVVWTLEARRSDFWSAEDGLATFLVPGDALPPGDYRFELRPRGAAEAGPVWPFRITAASR